MATEPETNVTDPQDVANDGPNEATPPQDESTAPLAVSPAAASEKPPRPFWARNWFFALLFVGILGIGIYFRFVGQNWDDFTHLHPDERFLADVASIINGPLNLSQVADPAQRDEQQRLCMERYPNSGSSYDPTASSNYPGVGTYFDAQCSTWYPKNAGKGLYVYGELPMLITRMSADLTRDIHITCLNTLLPEDKQNYSIPRGLTSSDAKPLKITDILPFLTNDMVKVLCRIPSPDDKQAFTEAQVVAQNWATYNGVQLVGRSVAAIAELLSLIFVFLIGRRLYNKWVGLTALALGVAAVFPIQLSHFWTTDAFTNLPVVMAMYFAVRAKDRGKWRDFILFGWAMGAALASRINTLPLIGVIGLAAILYALPILDKTIPRRERERLFQHAMYGLLLSFFFTFLSMRLFNPHAFIGGPGLAGFLAPFPIPVFLLVLLATLTYVLPGFTGSVPPKAQMRMFAIAGIIFVVGAIGTYASMRAFSPDSFKPGMTLPEIVGFYKPWLADLATARDLTSGNWDAPPNHQWASRAPYIFPLRNIILWGMGVPLGLLSCFGIALASWHVVRARRGWTRHMLMLAFIGVYFAYMGRQWVMTMRYFMPIYPFMIILAAWSGWELIRVARHWQQNHPGALQRYAYRAAIALLVFVIAFTQLWAVMFTEIYRRPLTRVEASNYFYENVPAGLSTTITGADGTTSLINMAMLGVPPNLNITFYEPNQRRVLPFIAQSASVDRVIVGRLLAPERSSTPKAFYVAIALDTEGTQTIATGKIQAPFDGGQDAFGDIYTIRLDKPITLDVTRNYYLVTWSDSRVVVSRTSKIPADFTIANDQSAMVAQASLPDTTQQIFKNLQGTAVQATAVLSQSPTQISFTSPMDGVIESLQMAHLINPLKDSRVLTVNFRLIDAVANTTLATAKFTGDAVSTRTSELGDSYSVKLDAPVTLKKDQPLILEASTPDGAPAQITGTVIATEGPWDDDIPWTTCTLPVGVHYDTPGVQPGMFNVANCNGRNGWGTLYRGEQLYMTAEDDQTKQQTMQEVLDQADYLTISSNRFYDSLSRLPLRFPMSIRFYDALFSGQMGFDLIKTVDSTFRLGDIKISDQYLPTYTSPKWLNEWESEEAFSVYDHPAVFIFKKNPKTYSPKYTSDVLTSLPLNDARQISLLPEDPTLITTIKQWGALQFSAAPTAFMMNSTLQAIQTQGGTWSALFNRDSILNTSPVAAVVVWWLVLMLFGFAVWPLLYTVLPGLPDRGYPMAKITGLLIVSWLAWVGGTARLLTWSNWGLLLILIAVAVFCYAITWRKRAELLAYMRRNWKHLLIIEGLTFLLFVIFLFIRLGNPDLWAQTLGGEKPMDLSYFTAVLRSTVFPPYDPWYAGGYLNYYYYGYVLVGAPVKMLGIMPSVAYNLLIPTLFALTGIGAFSVAFNLVAARYIYRRDEGSSEPGAPMQARLRFALRTPPGSPYVAGILAILLCTVLGNLTTPTVFMTGVANAGGCNPNPDMLVWMIDNFTKSHDGRTPTQEESQAIADAAQHPSLGDRISFGLHTIQDNAQCISRGFEKVLSGSYVSSVGLDRWYWAARSVVSELPNSNNEINEFPAFTFIFGDLHAHMIALPLTLLALVWLLSEILCSYRPERPSWVVFLSMALGGLTIGILRPTNSWDWITYLLLGVLGLLFAAWLRRDRLTRVVLTNRAAQIGWFFVANIIAALPFTAYFMTAYSSVKSFEGNKTPIWAYFTMHGIFLIIIVSVLIWQTARVLQHLYVRDFLQRRWPLILVGLVAVFVIGFGLLMAILPAKIWLVDMPIPLALVILPLLYWCVVLFLLPGQSREWMVVYAMIGLALGISLGVEIVVLDGDIGRQNTFFKFYMQVWMLFGITSAVGLAWMFRSLRRWAPTVRGVWLTIIVLLFVIGGLYPVLATQGKNLMRHPTSQPVPITLDGTAYMQYADYYYGSATIPMKDDLEIIHWLEDNVQGSPVILEGREPGSEYKYNLRITINTGLPSLLGWRFHQQQQRTLDPLPTMVIAREANIFAMYNTPDITTFWNMAKYYNIEYIIVAKLERAVMRPEGINKFAQMKDQQLLELVYDKNGDQIYRVIQGAVPVSSSVGQAVPSSMPVQSSAPYIPSAWKR